jgi:hypothetical protein
LTDLLQALTPRIDVNRVVKMFEKSDNIPLIKPFLLNVQSQNKKTVNSAINDLLIEEEDYKTLRDSVENYDNYDPVELLNVSNVMIWSSSAKSPPTSIERTSAGRSQLPFQSKTSCSRMPSKLRQYLASQMSLRSCSDT